MFKEFTDFKQRLTYVKKEVTYILMQFHDIITYILPKYGYITNLSKKIKLFLRSYVSFDWFTCVQHIDDVKKLLLDSTIPLIIRKFYDDMHRTLQSNKLKNKYDEKKTKKN